VSENTLWGDCNSEIPLSFTFFVTRSLNLHNYMVVCANTIRKLGSFFRENFFNIYHTYHKLIYHVLSVSLEKICTVEHQPTLLFHHLSLVDHAVEQLWQLLHNLPTLLLV
jgi:hypothetical protein